MGIFIWKYVHIHEGEENLLLVTGNSEIVTKKDTVHMCGIVIGERNTEINCLKLYFVYTGVVTYFKIRFA
jgi:hypothetical protein